MHKLTTGAALAGLLLLGLPACDSQPPRNESVANSATGNAAADNASAAKPAPAPAPAAPLVLEGAGLRIPGASPQRTLALEMPEAATIEALTKALGRPPTEQGENEECGGGGMKYAEWKDELTIWFLDGRFAGWDSEGKLKTIEVEESTLGTEFRAGGLSGILDSKGPAAKVEHLWGGATCVFR